jgi:hypothetical protein
MALIRVSSLVLQAGLMKLASRRPSAFNRARPLRGTPFTWKKLPSAAKCFHTASVEMSEMGCACPGRPINSHAANSRPGAEAQTLSELPMGGRRVFISCGVSVVALVPVQTTCRSAASNSQTAIRPLLPAPLSHHPLPIAPDSTSQSSSALLNLLPSSGSARLHQINLTS